MRRWVFGILVCVLAGAVVNVGVAWSCALWSSQDVWGSDRAVDVPATWPGDLERVGWPAPSAAHIVEGGPGVSVVEITGGDPDASWKRSGPGSEKTHVALMERRFGLPMRALQWEVHGVTAGPRAGGGGA